MLGSNYILVTGGAGFIGSHTCKALASSGYIPVTFDNLSNGNRHSVKWGPFIEGDICNRSDINKAFNSYNYEEVIHFSGLIDVAESSIKTELTGLDKILYILKDQWATKYISGDGEGSKRYIDEQLFKDNNIELIWQNYKHPTYNQLHGDFIPYLSILDLLFNEGPNTKEIILCK